MQRFFSRKSLIGPVPTLAAALLAAGALSVSAPAVAAPIGAASAVPFAAASPDIILIQGRSGKSNRGGARNPGDSHVFKQGGDRWDSTDWSRVDRGHSESRRDDRGHVEGRRDDRGHAEGRHDRGNHYGWERGKHYGWDKNDRDRDLEAHRSGDRPDWRAERRPSRWTGQDIGRVDANVLRDYETYGLPRPGPGQFYARSGDEVYLVTERTRRIMDAFMLRDLLR